MRLIDLHIHSNFSDGSDSVDDLVKKIITLGVKTFSLTDHDTVEGIPFIEKIIPKDINFIRGVELTCKTEINKCHLLGYGYDITNSDLLKQIKKSKNLRQIKLEKRIEHLKKVWNIELTDAELEFLHTRKSVVKTHFANIIVNRGLAEDNVSAMKKYIDACKTTNTRLEAEDVIKAIKSAGGISVWAHPLGGEGEIHLSKDEFFNQLKFMIKIGIQGLECYYSRYNNEEIEFLNECANKNNLLVSGGSDYHGTNKTGIEIAQLNTLNSKIGSDEFNILKNL